MWAAESAGLVSLLIGSLGGIAALIAAYVGYLVYKANREVKRDENRIDALQLGQMSLKDALERSDQDKADLRRQLMTLGHAHEEDRLLWRREMALLSKRLEAAELRESECWERVNELTEQIGGLT